MVVEVTIMSANESKNEQVSNQQSNGKEIKGVVFTHFSCKIDDLADNSKKDLQIDEWKKRFVNYYACKNQIEKVFVFISEGYQALLATREGEAPFISLDSDRTFIEMLKEASKKACKEANEKTECKEDFIITIGFDKMVSVMSKLQWAATNAEQQLNLLLLGDGKHMRYDSPKIVDAMLRIFGRANGMPVFRIDEDVKPNQKSFIKLLEAYNNLPQDKGFFVFSGGYGHWKFSKKDQQQAALINNYAVRTHHLAMKSNGKKWHINVDKCKNFLNGLTDIGAEQSFAESDDGGNSSEAQVISGAGFCLSYEAIKKLPPAANMISPITWIDDQLKRKMHEELNDLGENQISRVKDALFLQDRHPPLKTDDPPLIPDEWMQEENIKGYLSTLAKGCVFNALISTPSPFIGQLKVYLDNAKWPASRPNIFENDTKGKPTGLTLLGRELLNLGNTRLNLVISKWKGHHTIVDVASFLKPSSTGLEDNSQVSQILFDMDNYLNLLDIWSNFVFVLESVPIVPNKWVFDNM